MSSLIRLVVEPKSAKKRSRTMLPDLLDQLDSLTGLIRSLVDEETTVEVLSLSMQSPLVAELRTVRKRPDGRARPALEAYAVPARRLIQFIDAMDKGASFRPTRRARFDPFSINQFREVAVSLKANGSRAICSVDDEERVLDERHIAAAEAWLGNVFTSDASFTGEIRHININARRWMFTLYPPVGPKRVRCQFPAERLDFVKAAVGDTVVVSGLARYGAVDEWPIDMRVTDVRTLKPSTLSWLDLPEVMRRAWSEAPEWEKEAVLSARERA